MHLICIHVVCSPIMYSIFDKYSKCTIDTKNTMAHTLARDDFKRVIEV